MTDGLARARLLQGGPHCLIQDTGRRGTLAYGLTAGGALDTYAHAWANRLLGNARACATLEVTLGPVALEFTQPTQVSLTGAYLDFQLNDQAVATGQSLNIQRGDCLRGSFARSGVRAYIGVTGGWQTARQFGSRSRVLRETPDAAAVTGSELPYQTRPGLPTFTRRIPHQWTQGPAVEPGILDLIPGYQFPAFSRAAQQQVFDQVFRVSARSDRMAVRLEVEGNALTPPPGPWRSEGIADGAVQVPPDGQPLVMLADRQTIGGYPKVGCLSHRARSMLAQCRPGDRVRFGRIERHQAVADYQAFLAFFAESARR